MFTGNVFPENLLYRKSIVNTINPHCYCEAKKDSFYRHVLKSSDFLIPDGIGIVWAIRILTGHKVKRISGSDLHIHLLNKVEEYGGRVFYMGASPNTLLRIQKRIDFEFPNILVDTYSPPYKTEFSDEENDYILSKINQFNPDVLFVGMTAPKQEKWVYKHKELINANVIASIGAVFDFYAGTIKRPGKLWIQLGLEWLPRLLREPKRLWRRNIFSTPSFLWDIILSKLKLINYD